MPSPTSVTFYLVGTLFSAAAGAVFILSLAGLAIRKRRRAMASAVSVMSWLVLAAALLAGFAYLSEIWTARFRGNPYEWTAYSYRLFGPSAWAYWLNAFGNVLAPQLFWFRRCRTNLCAALLISVAALLPGTIERMITALLYAP